MNAWKVCCGKCHHTWTLMGNWSVYEREALESRPCPQCDSYTLSSPEPTLVANRRPRPHMETIRKLRTARLAG